MKKHRRGIHLIADPPTARHLVLADVAMISGGGQPRLIPREETRSCRRGKGRTTWQSDIWFPTSPLKAIRAKAPDVNVEYDSGTDPSAAAALAKTADVAIVFAYQWESEGMDLESLSLPEHQDDLILKVAAANPHTIVVLETGSPVTMPWADQVSGILEPW
jgi:beta-glucosidase